MAIFCVLQIEQFLCQACTDCVYLYGASEARSGIQDDARVVTRSGVRVGAGVDENTKLEIRLWADNKAR